MEGLGFKSQSSSGSTSDLKTMPGQTLVLMLVAPIPAFCDWVIQPVVTITCESEWQTVKLSKQTCLFLGH